MSNYSVGGTNTPLLKDRKPSSFGKDETETRNTLRRNVRNKFADDLRRRFCGQGRDGGRQWPPELCPRSRRRAIIRDGAKRIWREKLEPKQ